MRPRGDPGLAAKPVIDIDLAVTDSADETSYVPELESAGYRLTRIATTTPAPRDRSLPGIWTTSGPTSLAWSEQASVEVSPRSVESGVLAGNLCRLQWIGVDREA